MTTLRRKLWRDVARSKPQFIAISITVFLGITLFAASYDSFRNLESSYDQTATDFRFANLFVRGGDIDSFVAFAAEADGVESVQARTSVDIPLQVSGVKMLGRVVSLPDQSQPDVNMVKVLEGAYLADDGILAEEHLAQEFHLVPGSSVEVLTPAGWETLGVSGVVSSPEYIWPARDRQDLLTTPEDFGVVFVSDSVVGGLTGIDEANDAGVYYAGGEEDAVLSEELIAAAYSFGAAEAYTRTEQASNAALAQDLQGFEEMSLFFPILFLAAAAMAAYVMVNRLVHAQRPQVGLLMAEGYSQRQVLRHYLGYGLVPGLLGALPGAVAGVLLARLITGWYTEIISVPVKVVELRWSTLLVAIVFGLFTSVVAAWAPARTASRMRPADTMRGVMPVGRGRPSVPERVLPPLRALPIRWRMALRGIERSPRRTIYTMLGVVLSLVLILVSWGMLDTVNYFVDRQFNDISREDARVFFAEPLTGADVEALEDIPGVAVVERSLELPAALAANGARYDTALVILEADTVMHGFYEPGGAEAGLPNAGILAGSFLADRLAISEGEVVELSLPGFGTGIPVPVAGFVEEPMGTFLYASRDAATLLAGSELPATSALVGYEAGVDRQAVRNSLMERAEVAAVTDAKSLLELVDRYMGLFYGFIGVMLLFGAAMAFALIFNSMSVNIAERTREVATLQAVGMEQGTITRLITSENLVVAVAGIPPGLVLGWWVSSLAMSSFNTDLFRFDLRMQPMTLLWSAAAIAVVALLSQLPGLRAVRRLDIPRIVKERTG